jgi:hypothetical protein
MTTARLHEFGRTRSIASTGQLIRPPTLSGNDNGSTGALHCRSRLGGLLNFYYRKAA